MELINELVSLWTTVLTRTDTFKLPQATSD